LFKKHKQKLSQKYLKITPRLQKHTQFLH